MSVLSMVGIAFGLLPSLVFACSAPRDKTPQQLVAMADAIYLVQAPSDGVVTTDRRAAEVTLPFIVLETLKGDPVNQFAVMGHLTGHDDYNDGEVPYDFVRSSGRRGSCDARDYAIGGQFLFIMKNGSPHWAALAPTNEQVVGPEDPWVLWVKEEISNQSAL